MIGEQGQKPLLTNATLASSFSGEAAYITNQYYKGLRYREVETNGMSNFNCRKGTVSLWFRPDWTSANEGGQGPRNYARLIEVGSYDNTNGFWSLMFTLDGSGLNAYCHSNGFSRSALSSPAHLLSNQWCNIVLTYSPSATALYTNGHLAATGSGMIYWPNSAGRSASGLEIGCDGSSQQVGGRIDELESYNYPLSSSEIETKYIQATRSDKNLNGLPDLLEDLPQSGPFSEVPVVVAGTLEAENFDRGGNGVGYLAVNTNSPSNYYRATYLNIEPCDDLGGGFCLTSLRTGDWMKYTIQVAQTGDYVVEVRAAPPLQLNQGGSFFVSFGGSNYNLQIANPGWQDCKLDRVHLDAGSNVLWLCMTQNASTSEFVGRINHISIYPHVDIPLTNGPVLNVLDFGATNNGSGGSSAISNREAFKNAIKQIGANGGVIYVPAGCYVIAQEKCSESAGAWASQNFCVELKGKTNISIIGDGWQNTQLVGSNRLATIFLAANADKVRFQGMELCGQPYIRANGQYDPGAYANAPIGSYSSGWGALMYLSDCRNVTLDSCRVRNPTLIGVTMGNIHGFTAVNCDFTFWDGEPTYARANREQQSVGIFSTGLPCTNIVLDSCTFNGNASQGDILNHNTSDGLACFQAGGNWYVTRCVISNYLHEAIAFTAGPAGVTMNQFTNGTMNGATCALFIVPFWAGLGGISDRSIFSWDHSYSFVGNSVIGGRRAVLFESSASSYDKDFLHLRASGNYARPLMDQSISCKTAWDAFAWGYNCLKACITGNTIDADYGVVCDFQHQYIEVLNNDFRNTGRMPLAILGSPGNLEQVIVAGNILGKGQTEMVGEVNWGSDAHLRLRLEDCQKFFLYCNDYLTQTNGAITGPLVTTPIGAPIRAN